MTERTREGVTDYDSLQVTANHRLTGELEFGAAYTLGKTMSMINALTVYLDPRDRLYAYDSGDRRHILSFQGSWNVPNGSRLWHSAVGRVCRRLATRRDRLLAERHAIDGHLHHHRHRRDRHHGRRQSGPGVAGRGVQSGSARGTTPDDRWIDTSCFVRTPVGSSGIHQ